MCERLISMEDDNITHSNLLKAIQESRKYVFELKS